MKKELNYKHIRKLIEHHQNWWAWKDYKTNKESLRNIFNAVIEDIKTIKNTYLITIGRGGCTLYYDSKWGPAKMETYSNGEPYLSICKEIGIPWVDTRTIPDKLLYNCIHVPLTYREMGNKEPDNPPWNMFSKAPIEVVIACYAILGAKYGNIEPDFDKVVYVEKLKDIALEKKQNKLI